MFLALREMRRAVVRFGLLIGSVALLMFLILFQQTLQEGLITSFVGAIERQTAPVLVYPVDGRRNLQGSVITPDLEAAIRGAKGVGSSGRIGQGTFSVTTSAGSDTAAVLGYEVRALGAPQRLRSGRYPQAVGEAVALDTAGDGYGLGDVVRIQPGGAELTVVGTASRVGIQASPTLFTSFATYEEAVRAANPDAAAVLPAAIGVAPADGVTDAQLVDAVNDASPDADALRRADAAAETPGVAQVQQSFQLIFLLFGLVVPLVTGLFFLIVTVQKAPSLTLLRAVGIPASTLVRSLLAQVAIVLVAGIALGILLYTPLASQTIGSIPLSFQTGAAVQWSVLLLVLGLVSAWFSARRVLRIDPIAATQPQGMGA